MEFHCISPTGFGDPVFVCCFQICVCFLKPGRVLLALQWPLRSLLLVPATRQTMVKATEEGDRVTTAAAAEGVAAHVVRQTVAARDQVEVEMLEQTATSKRLFVVVRTLLVP